MITLDANIARGAVPCAIILLTAACATRIDIPDQDPSPPEVTLKQIVNPQSPTLRRVGTVGSRPFRQDVSGMDRIGLLGHADDEDSGAMQVALRGSMTTRCRGIFGVRDLEAESATVPIVRVERQAPDANGQVSPILNVVEDMDLDEWLDKVRQRCGLAFKSTGREWISGTVAAFARNFANVEAQTHEYEFIWKPCTEANQGSANDLVITVSGSDQYRIRSNNQWSTFGIGNAEAPSAPSWSPCKDRIAFSAHPAGAGISDQARNIYIADRSGNVETLTDSAVCTALQREANIEFDGEEGPHTCQFSEPDWSAANEIAAGVQFFTDQVTASGRFLVVFDGDSGEARLIKQSHDGLQVGVWNPKWSRDGDRLIIGAIGGANLPMAEGVFVTTPGFRSVCPLDIPGSRPQAWADADGPGGNSRVALEVQGQVHVVVLGPPATPFDCPTVVSDAPLVGTRAGDRDAAVSVTEGDFAFLRGSGGSTEVVRESGGQLVTHIGVPAQTEGLDF